MRIALAQINCTVGDLSGNVRKIEDSLRQAQEMGADIVCFPELAITGYPPEDLLLKPKFIRDNLAKLEELAGSVGDIVTVAGFADLVKGDIYNAAAVIYRGKIKGVYHKMLLPNYSVFDERRYFKAGSSPDIFRYGDLIFAINICEDIWHTHGPTKQQVLQGAKLVVNISASPYFAGKAKERQQIIQRQAEDNRVFIAYCNLVGGQDELVFDGRSIVVNDQGKIIAQAEAFKEDLLLVDLNIPAYAWKRVKPIITVTNKLPKTGKEPLPRREIKAVKPLEEIYQALLLGLQDYVSKNGFQKVVIGLSGGIDSSLVAVLASDALGSDNVAGIFMPSRYSSPESAEDARKLAEALGIKFMNIPIEQIYRIYLMVLEPYFFGLPRDITEENLQARIRGNILMALSNKFGWLVLTTGNKSEMSTGYATLYGDMAGGFAIIKDVPKTLVYKLAQYRNLRDAVIPRRVFSKPPTAELRPNQKDSDTLPRYADLDRILKAYIQEDKDVAGILSLGFDAQTVVKVLGMVDKSEYKRRQSPPGIKITPRAFGRDRRMPITNKYKG